MNNRIISILILVSAGFSLFSQNVQINVDLTSEKHQISPYIFGKNNSLSDNPGSPLSEEEWHKLRDVGIKMFRDNGGNNSTKYNWKRKLSVNTIILEGSSHLPPNVTVSNVFSDNMVLQQNSNVPVWGWANPGDTVTASGSWDNEIKKTVTDSTGKWTVYLETPGARTDGTSYSLTIIGNNTIEFTNVLIGEVWLLSGQSNMEMPLRGWTNMPIEGSADAIANANLPEIRLLSVARKSSATKEKELSNSSTQTWSVCTPSTAAYFSAVGFFFGRELHQNLNIPIGLVQSSWGGSSCETWANSKSIDLVTDFAGMGPWVPKSTTDNKTATVLYNGMIAPLVPFKFAGACWYQGESNVGRAEQLTSLFPSMIEGWRSDFHNDKLPFYFVQLAPYDSYSTGLLPEFWEAQAYTLNLHDTEMATAIDIGELDEIHPAKKFPVGYRLAQKALALNYGYDTLIYAGPRYDSLRIEGDKIRLFFSHTGSGLMAEDNQLKDFEISANGRDFYPADALIEDTTIVVSKSNISSPLEVRYAWTKKTTASLLNNEGFPAIAFRTNPPEYIKTVNTSLLVNRNLITEGEAVEISWTSIGADSLLLNGSSVNTSGNLKVSPDSTSSYKIEAFTSNNESTSTLQQVFVIPKELNSWGREKSVSASSEKNNYPAEYAVDQDMETAWRSTSNNNQTFTIDLGEKIPVNLIILHWGTSYGKAYVIQISDDMQNWTTIFEEKDGDGDMDFIGGLNQQGRYVKIKGLARSGATGYTLKELQVYSSEYRKTGTLLDKNQNILRGTPMILGKRQQESVEFALDIKNWETIRDNGFNTIRVCWVDPWYKNRSYDHWTVNEVLPYFDQCVANAGEAGMNIILNFHGVGAQQYYDTTYQFNLEKEFWDAIAPRYKDNDLVYYEIANEPTFRMEDYLKPAFKQGLLEIYAGIRAKAPEREILLFSFNTIKDEILPVVEAYKTAIDWDKTSIAYHMYNSESSQAVKTLMAYHRVICTEWNYDHVSKTEGHEYIKQVDGFKLNAQTLEKIGSGWIDWRDWSDITLNELTDTLIYDAHLKNYWWGQPVQGLKVTGVKMFPHELVLPSEGEGQLTAYVVPALADNQGITWESSATNIAVVNQSGHITAIATQNKTTTIKAISADGNHQASSTIEVLAPEKKGAYPDGIPHPVPGTINPTHYDKGGEGVGYHDTNEENLGDGIRQEQGVDTGYLLEEGSVGGIQSGEWLEYTLDVQKEGDYNIYILFATPGRFGKFHLEFNEEDKTGSIFVFPSSGYETFRETKVENIHLTKGETIMRIVFDFAMYNLGTIRFERIIPVSSEEIQETNSLQVFPNPVTDLLTVELNITNNQNICLQLLNIHGQLIHTFYDKKLSAGFHQVSADVNNLPAGMYYIVAQTGDKKKTKKIMINN